MMLQKVLKYCPDLNPITGSVTASLLMCQLEYWFDKTDCKPFYKFLEPCADECYKTGDSWVEELGFSVFEFRTAFAKIGKVYKSKTDYMKSKDKFEGKFYLSYRDRIKKRTYYIRNTPAVSKLLLSLQSQCGYSKDYSQPTHKETISDIDYEQILHLYHHTCPSLPKVSLLTPKYKKKIHDLWRTLEQSGKDALHTFKQAFEQVEASDFLCGRTSKSTWRAILDWILKPQKFFDILDGKYAPFPSKTSTPTYSPYTPKPQPTFLRVESHNFDLTQLEALERLHQQRIYEAKLHNLPQSML